MADTQALLDSTGEHLLNVWAVPALRRQVQAALDLWNAAIGRTWLVLNPNKADAQVHVLSKMYKGDAPSSGISRAELGGEGAGGPLKVWINPGTTKDFLLTTITHELGHSLGLADAYPPNRMSQTPSGRGIMSQPMSKAGPPGPTEGAQARGDQGLSPPFNWSPESQADYQGAGIDPYKELLGAYKANWLDHVQPAKRASFLTAASLVVAGLRARGVEPADYAQGNGEPADHLAVDAQTMFRALHPQAPAKRPAPVGGGGGPEKRE